MSIRARSGVALGAAGVVAAGVMWAGAGGASAGDDQLRGWEGKDAGSVAAATQMAAAQSRGDDKDGTRLVVRARTTGEAEVDVGEAGETAGDYFLFEDRLLSRDGNRVLGRDSGRCELGITTFTCEATARINGKGKIRVAGSFFAERDNVLPVTGGTGDYKDVGGQLRVFDLPNGDTLLVFRLTH